MKPFTLEARIFPLGVYRTPDKSVNTLDCISWIYSSWSFEQFQVRINPSTRCTTLAYPWYRTREWGVHNIRLGQSKAKVYIRNHTFQLNMILDTPFQKENALLSAICIIAGLV